MHKKRTTSTYKFCAVMALACAILFSACEGESDSREDILVRNFMGCIFFGGCYQYLQSITPCTAEKINPGETRTLDLTVRHGISLEGCSANPWTLTATPSADIKAEIEESQCHRQDLMPATLAKSTVPGQPISITGPAGCMTDQMQSVLDIYPWPIDDSYASGSIVIAFL